ncbi:MAG: DUF2442 domain-containing protein [Azonexus sp.]|mgnify:CR=1 FL=1|nr:DUF2442 domain-containing protein [Azonexus sp.]
MRGQHISVAEVSVASNQGFWLLLDEEELYLPFSAFPWFRKASLEQVMAVERLSKSHLYWPMLDIDLSVESIRRPNDFPLIARSK